MQLTMISLYTSVYSPQPYVYDMTNGILEYQLPERHTFHVTKYFRCLSNSHYTTRSPNLKDSYT